jgi:putative ABC transport system substrate-binding protein
MNNRRKLVIALGVGALVTPYAAFAQAQGKVWRIGFLAPRRRPDALNPDTYFPFVQGMRELGYVEGKNLLIEWRYADNKTEPLPGLAEELVQLKVDAIVTIGTPATRAAKNATTTIPIVIGTATDPLGSGLIESLAHPGGNITGLSLMLVDIGPKHLEMLLTMAPRLTRVAVLLNPTNPAQAGYLKSIQTAAQKINIKILPVQAGTAAEIDTAFAVMVRERVGAVIVWAETLFVQNAGKVAELAMRNRLPSISARAAYAEVGGLMSYGQDVAYSYRRTATYVDKILKGAKPADLPVEQPTKFELVINGKTAKALGIKIPQTILVRADKVIE